MTCSNLKSRGMGVEKRLSWFVEGRCSHRVRTHVQMLSRGGKEENWSQIHVFISHSVNG